VYDVRFLFRGLGPWRREVDMMTTRRALLLGGLRVAGGIALASCAAVSPQGTAGGSAAPSAPKRGGNLVTADINDAVSLDPAFMSALPGRRPGRALYDALVELDENNNIIPNLVESWDRPDATTWIFRLKQGVKFHDGTPFNAEAVKFHFDRHLDPKVKSRRSGELVNVAGAEIVDANTVRIRTKVPSPHLLFLLFDWTGYVVSPTAVQRWGDDYGQHAVGTGPFRFVEYKQGERVVLERNPDYWDKGKPYLDTLTFRPIINDATRLIEVRSAGAHIGHDVPLPDVQRVSQLTDVKLSSIVGVRMDIWNWNPIESPYARHAAFRQALNWVLDREAIHRSVFFGTGRVNYAPNFPGSPFYDEGYKPFTRDLNKAKQLLDEAYKAGAPSPAKFTIYNPSADTTAQKLAQIIQANYNDVGVTVDLQTEDGAAAQARNDNGGFTLSVAFGWWAWRPDPSQGYLRSIFHSKSTYSKRVVADAEIDRLIEAGDTEPALDKRKQIYTQLWSRINEVAAAVLFHAGEGFVSLSPKLQGWVHRRDDQPRYKNLWLE
jgi:peptide/nickel transport system substrate-binding protein